MKFKCVNEKCEYFGEELSFHSVKFQYIDGKLFAPIFCNLCGKHLVEIPDDTPISEKNISIGKFAGMIPQQRQQVLKKRAKEHATKVEKIDEIKRHKWTEAVEKFKKVP